MKFKVSLKQGQKTWTEYIEADSLKDVLNFYRAVSTAKVVRVEQILYEDNSKEVPLDDRNYFSLVKVIARRDGFSRQYIFHNVKLSLSVKELADLMRQYLKVAGGKIEGVITVLWKR
jgi:hypothetical protein